MKKVIRLNENDIENLVKKIIKEDLLQEKAAPRKMYGHNLEGKCSYCGSNLYDDQLDAEYTNHMGDGKRYFKCSDCGATQSLEPKKVKVTNPWGIRTVPKNYKWYDDINFRLDTFPEPQ